MDRWAACATGLVGPAAWRNWLENPVTRIASVDKPPLPQVPAAIRRRLEPLGRLAFQAAWECRPEAADCPMVLCSRYGELSRPLELLLSIAAHESMSPTQFSLAVHNAIGAQYSIARSQRSSSAAIAAGDETVEAGFIDALGLLRDGASEVLIVCYEEPPPDVYGAPTAGEFAHAWACQISASTGAGIGLEAVPLPQGVPTTRDPELSASLAALRFLASSERRAFDHPTAQRLWQWRRHD
jgi:Beta-ketoacyl synthase, N-terminal domain